MRTMRTNIESPAPKQWEPKLFKGGISCWFVSLFNHFVTHNIHVCLVLTHVAKPFIEIGRSSMDQIVTLGVDQEISVTECICVIVYFCISVQVKERQWIKLTPPSPAAMLPPRCTSFPSACVIDLCIMEEATLFHIQNFCIREEATQHCIIYRTWKLPPLHHIHNLENCHICTYYKRLPPCIIIYSSCQKMPPLYHQLSQNMP